MKKVILVVLDGWGINPSSEANATVIASTPNLDRFYNKYPNTTLNASGLAVGLPDGQIGNSEVGHLTLGSGRVVYQDLTRIDHEIETGGFFENEVLKSTISQVKTDKTALHLMGLISDGGVHSHINHLYAILKMAKMNGLENVYIHAFMDGRDTPPKSGIKYVGELQSFIAREGVGGIATVIGRYYAMDRDNRWERVEEAYVSMVHGRGKVADDPISAVKAAYNRGETDEFILPTVVEDSASKGRIKDGDSILFFNFRADRARELTRAFTEKGFREFDIRERPRLSRFVCFTEYESTFALPVVFSPQSLKNIMASILSHREIRQFRIAETEKYAHVTFFFNGGIEKPFYREERQLVQSPKDVPTYDLKPEMSAYGVTEALIKRIKDGRDNFILVNYANGDMVGHTGVLEAAVKACEVVDGCIGRVVEVADKLGWSTVVTADHGNVEQMIDYDTGEPYTAHTNNPVPFILIDRDLGTASLRSGGLSDVAPTILGLLELGKPEDMDGESLIV